MASRVLADVRAEALGEVVEMTDRRPSYFSAELVDARQGFERAVLREADHG